MKNKLYLLTQSINSGWDTYDSMVIAAKDEEQAKEISLQTGSTGQYGSWAEPKYINAECIGETHKEAGLILSSFNAG